MNNGYIAKEAKRMTKNTTSVLVKASLAALVALAVLYFVTRSDAETSRLFTKIGLGFTLYLVLVGGIRLLNAKRRQGNYANLQIHSKEITKEEAGRTIDDEAAQGKILVEEYIDKSSSATNPKGEKIVLLPSYLLLCDNVITAIPVDKIYWICAQVGYKGGPYIVRIKIFAENKMYDAVGADIDHAKDIVDKIYRYIPNIFSNYDASDLSYKLEEIFRKDYNQFLEFYQQHKQDFLRE